MRHKTPGTHPARRRLTLPALALFFLLSSAIAPSARAQACSLCRDATAGSAPHAREALRKGILALGIPAGAIFLVILLTARRYRNQP